MYFHSVHHCSLEDVQTLSWSRWQAIEFIFVFYFQRAHTQIRLCYKKTVWQSEMCPSSGTFNHFWLGKLRPHSSEIGFLSKWSIIFHIRAFWLLLEELVQNELTSFRFPVFLIRTQKLELNIIYSFFKNLSLLFVFCGFDSSGVQFCWANNSTETALVLPLLNHIKNEGWRLMTLQGSDVSSPVSTEDLLTTSINHFSSRV